MVVVLRVRGGALTAPGYSAVALREPPPYLELPRTHVRPDIGPDSGAAGARLRT